MTSLLVRCRSCRQDVEAGFCDRSLVCGTCRATRAIAADLILYERYWRKREHYRRAGVSLKAIDTQLVKLVVRMQGRVLNHLRDSEGQRELLNRLLADAREKAQAETKSHHDS